MKRRGNRRYYQHHEVLMIRRIRDLLYDQGFTISGARNKLQELVQVERDQRRAGEVHARRRGGHRDREIRRFARLRGQRAAPKSATCCPQKLSQVRRELFEIRDLLSTIRELLEPESLHSLRL